MMLIGIDFGRNDGTIPSGISRMNSAQPWIVARLGDDFNWWLEQASDELGAAAPKHGLLDPRQITYLIEALDAYRSFGYRRQQFADAFQVFALESEIAEGAIRLAATGENIFSGGELFALPRLGDEGDGPYFTLLDAITNARIRCLNQTHHYARVCTDQDLTEELDALDANRYFDLEQIHVFEEINEILEWSPAEWDDSSVG
jgi:hypothetical protein